MDWNNISISKYFHTSAVAPFTGAWIEINLFLYLDARNTVAPFTGAWIEIRSELIKFWPASSSLPSRERGLKLFGRFYKTVALESLPSRERGLKYWNTCHTIYLSNVAPFTGAWIEILSGHRNESPKSCRSLHGSMDWNLYPFYQEMRWKCRSLHGSVDWNWKSWLKNKLISRRSLHGSVDWNIGIVTFLNDFYKSLPSRERGLKFRTLLLRSLWGACRSLHGSVDWNGGPLLQALRNGRRSLHGSVDWNVYRSLCCFDYSCRSLHGSVDWN